MSEQDCLAALSQLPALITLGLIPVRQADSLRGICNSILQHYRRQEAGTAAGSLETSRLLDAVRKNPEIASMLEPLVTDEQIRMLLGSG
jgi:hypothetical protein